MREQLNLTEEDGYEALRGHVVTKALEARAAHGPTIEGESLAALLADDQHLRFPTRLAFSKDELKPGEFAWAKPLGERPSDGYELVVHAALESRPRDAALAAAYHIVTINYLDIAGSTEAELYGATLHGLEVEDYYERLCALADELDPRPASEREAAEAAVRELESPSGGSCCGGGCHG